MFYKGLQFLFILGFRLEMQLRLLGILILFIAFANASRHVILLYQNPELRMFKASPSILDFLRIRKIMGFHSLIAHLNSQLNGQGVAEML
ncbi:unnamed protein product [Phyllotreta striolata]|uniref:Uncharacterized protein n=1 Tax=Phyllotreta striolata TaxID=444603 RepID=A0A9N9TAB3_PHYSR|nr:unnamed protein product [Phyllotreta striolata]